MSRLVQFLLSLLIPLARWKSGPLFIRRGAFWSALQLAPCAGGIGPINGAQVVIRIDDDSVGPLDVAYQRDVTFDTTNALIDVSNKNSGRRAVYLLGRLEEEISLEMFWSDEASYTLLRNVARAGQAIKVIRALDDAGDGVYTNIEWAEAVITQLSEAFPDQEGGTVSVTFRLSGNWIPGTP